MERLKDIRVFSAGARRYVSLADVVGATQVDTEEGMISRREHVRTLTVMANPVHGENSVEAFERIRAAIKAIPLPSSYAMEWGGEHESSSQAQESLMRQLPLGGIGMILLVLMMFGRLKSALIVLLIVPMSICSATLGLLLFNGAFGFMALLGLLSLVGMLIKNAVVLVEEIDIQIETGESRMKALVERCMSSLRPVGLAAGTTILGMVPLLWDSFFKNMAITMMAGLAFATMPALYALFFSIEECGLPPMPYAESFPLQDPQEQCNMRTFFGLGVGLMLGTAWMPHILMRSYTTSSVSEARRSICWSLFFILLLYCMAPALALFVKYEVYTQVVESHFLSLPSWVHAWTAVNTYLLGILDINRDGIVQLAEISMGADVVVLAMPEIGGFSLCHFGFDRGGGSGGRLVYG